MPAGALIKGKAHILEALQYTISFLLYRSLLKKQKYRGMLIRMVLIVNVLTPRGKKIIVGDLKRSHLRTGPEVKAATHKRIIENFRSTLSSLSITVVILSDFRIKR